jgi:hypothetical protein
MRPVLGVGGSVRVLGPVWVRAEALTVTKGYAKPNVSHRALYLELPVLLEIVLPWRHEVKLRAVAGVAPSSEVSCSAHVQLPYGRMQWIGSPVDFPVDCDENRERNDVGRVYGGGFGPFTVAGLKITPELRIVSGSVHSSGTDLEPREGELRSRHRTWSAVVSISR